MVRTLRSLLVVAFFILAPKSLWAVCSSPAGEAGQVLFQSPNLIFCDGTNWTNLNGAGGTPGGASGNIQFNAGGSLGGDSNLVWDPTNQWLGINKTPSGTPLDILVPPGEVTGIRIKGGTWDDVLLDLESDSATGRAGISFYNYLHNTFMIYSEGSPGSDLVFNNGNNWNSPSSTAMRLSDNGELAIASSPIAGIELLVNGDASISGSVGIGTTNPSNNLEIMSATSASLLVTNDDPTGNPNSKIRLQNFRKSYGDGNPAIISYVARGTKTTPSAVTSGMKVLSLQGRGYASGGYGVDRDGASIDFVAKDNWQNSVVTTDIIFNTASYGTWENSEKMRIGSDGNVGIGTSSASRPLHVNGAMRLEPITSASVPTPVAGDIYFDSASSNLKYHNGTSWVTAGGGSGSSVWSTSGSIAYYNSGNVGVGTSSALDKVEVYDGDLRVSNTGASPARLTLWGDRANNSGDAGETVAQIKMRSDGTGNNDGFDVNMTNLSSANDLQFVGVVNGTPTTIFTMESPSGDVSVNTGEFGVGVASPSDKVEVYDGDLRVSNTGASPARLTLWGDRGNDSGDAGETVAQIKMRSDGTSNDDGFDISMTNLSSDNDLQFTGVLGGTPSTIMTLKSSSGRVGIGTTSPTRTLDVSGHIGAWNVYSSVLYTANGSAGSPSVSFQSGSDSGMWRPGSNMIAFSTSGNERMRIDTGDVGIGTTTPRARLDVQGGSVVGEPAVANATSTIDFSTGNIQYTTANCGAFNLHNLKDGGSYNFVVQGATSATCSFSAYSDAGTTALTVKLPPGHGATTASTHTFYTFVVAGSNLYVSWVPGY